MVVRICSVGTCGVARFDTDRPCISFLYVHHGHIDLYLAQEIRLYLQLFRHAKNHPANGGYFRHRACMARADVSHVAWSGRRRTVVRSEALAIGIELRSSAHTGRDATTGALIRSNGADCSDHTSSPYPVSDCRFTGWLYRAVAGRERSRIQRNEYSFNRRPCRDRRKSYV